jgi:hypothetical protein
MSFKQFVLLFYIILAAGCLPAPASISIYATVDKESISQVDIDNLVRGIVDDYEVDFIGRKSDDEWDYVDKYSKQFILPTETKLSGAVIYVPKKNKLRIIFIGSTKEEEFSEQEKIELKNRISTIEKIFNKYGIKFTVTCESI